MTKKKQPQIVAYEHKAVYPVNKSTFPQTQGLGHKALGLIFMRELGVPATSEKTDSSDAALETARYWMSY